MSDLMNRDKEFLGQGLAFPLQVNPRGALALVTGPTDIEQAIYIILGTIPGERVMRPEFGCRAWELVFAPNNASTRSLLVLYVRQALEFWEPRIELIDVDVGLDEEEESTLLVEIRYKIKATHDERSIVYPFYLMGAE
ncbi:MAG TPA: GPW/gp25 family protein [Caldilineaceae bacterium]|nr:GPW/gp25 family protein [Caldilineaceae bacterium]